MSCRFCSVRTPFLFPYSFKASLLSGEAWKTLLNIPETVHVPSVSFSSISTSVDSVLRFLVLLNTGVLLFSSSVSQVLLSTSSELTEFLNMQQQPHLAMFPYFGSAREIYCCYARYYALTNQIRAKKNMHIYTHCMLCAMWKMYYCGNVIKSALTRSFGFLFSHVSL